VTDTDADEVVDRRVSEHHREAEQDIPEIRTAAQRRCADLDTYEEEEKKERRSSFGFLPTSRIRTGPMPSAFRLGSEA